MTDRVIPDGWESTTTTELIREKALLIGDGYRAKNSEFVDDGGLPFIRVGDITNRIRTDVRDELPLSRVEHYEPKVSQTNDSLITMKGTVGRVARVSSTTRRFVYSPQISFWRVRDPLRLDPRFVSYWLRSPAFAEQAIATKSGTDMADYINLRDQRRMSLLLPPLATQQRVATVLSAFDELIEINQRRIDLLEDLARSLYREWFVRFRFPGHEDATFVDSARGEIPERWTVCRLDAIAAIVMGQSPRSEFYNEIGEGLPFHQGVADYGDLLPTHRKYCTLESRTADAMDLLCSVRAPVGRLNLADERLVIGRGLAAIRRVDDNQALLLEQLRYPLGEEDSLGSGTIFKAINKEQLGGLPIVEPTADIARAFELKARPMLDERVQRTLQNRQLAGTRDLLLPRLVTGRLDIAEIDLGELLPPEAA